MNLILKINDVFFKLFFFKLLPKEDDLSKNFCERIISKWTEEITKSSSQQHGWLKD